jgi:hypothetical protein
MFAAVLIAMTYFLVMISQDYLAYGYDVSITVQSATTLTFPAVTVCNMCPVRRTRWSQLSSKSSSNIPSTSQPLPSTDGMPLADQTTAPIVHVRRKRASESDAN